MIIILEEMAQFKGAGISVDVRSNDHGAIGNSGNPAHVHVFDSSGRKELAELEITENPPNSPADVKFYRTKNIPDGLGRAVVKFAKMPCTKSEYKKLGLNITNWQAVKEKWMDYHSR